MAQTIEEGTVTFTSSKHIYVKFKSTKALSIGDSLYMQQGGNLIPALVIDNKSSTSTVCTPIIDRVFNKGDKIVAKIPKKNPKVEEEPVIEPPITGTENDSPTELNPEEEIAEISTPQKIKGRVSVASYSNFSDFRNRTRMRYTFSFRGDNIKDSKFSTAAYINYHHYVNDPDIAQTNIAENLKVYSLFGKYDFNKSTSLALGRKINSKFSSVGAIDGLQFEKSFNRLQVGAIAGFRPNLSNYAPDFNLFQYGAFVGLGPKAKKGARQQQTTLGFIEQRNGGAIDRRYMYLQHQGELAKNLNLFSSVEIDLYENLSDSITTRINNSPQLTNLYISLRYRVSKNFRVSTSYDNRKNIIYYESYKNFIDQLIQDESRQGLRFGFTYRPWKYISWTTNAGMRFQNNGTNNSKNVNTYVSYSRIPFLNMRGTVNFTYLQTDYLSSMVYGVRLSKELVKKRLRGNINYRRVNYRYIGSDSGTNQHIAGFNLSLTLMKQLNLHLYYEGAFDDNKPQTNHRFNTRLIFRF